MQWPVAIFHLFSSTGAAIIYWNGGGNGIGSGNSSAICDLLHANYRQTRAWGADRVLSRLFSP